MFKMLPAAKKEEYLKWFYQGMAQKVGPDNSQYGFFLDRSESFGGKSEQECIDAYMTILDAEEKTQIKIRTQQRKDHDKMLAVVRELATRCDQDEDDADVYLMEQLYSL